MITPGLMSVLIRTNGRLNGKRKKNKKSKTQKQGNDEAQSNSNDSEDSVPEKNSTTLLIGHPMIKNILGTKLGEAVGH